MRGRNKEKIVKRNVNKEKDEPIRVWKKWDTNPEQHQNTRKGRVEEIAKGNL